MMSSDWCPENDGAYRSELAAMYEHTLMEKMAEAWDEGYDAASDVWQKGTPNPYRKGTT